MEQKYEAAMKKYKYRITWSDKNIKEMCESIGRPDLYNSLYRLQCTVSHTNARSMNEYLRHTDQGIILNIGSNWDLTQSSLVIVFDCFFHIAKEANKQFNWSGDDVLEKIAQRYGKEVSRLNKE